MRVPPAAYCRMRLVFVHTRSPRAVNIVVRDIVVPRKSIEIQLNTPAGARGRMEYTLGQGRDLLAKVCHAVTAP